MIQRLQNRAARIIIGNYSRDVSGIDLVKDLGWLNVRQRRDYFTSILVFKALNEMAPNHISDLFTYTRDTHTYCTRSASTDNLNVPRVKKHVFSQSLKYNGPMLWNSLSQSLRSACSLGVFKHNCRNFMINKTYST